jgi:hypothetical protein
MGLHGAPEAQGTKREIKQTCSNIYLRIVLTLFPVTPVSTDFLGATGAPLCGAQCAWEDLWRTAAGPLTSPWPSLVEVLAELSLELKLNCTPICQSGRASYELCRLD